MARAAILRTGNGGLDWREVRKAGTAQFRAIAVSADGNVAVAAGDNAILIARGEKQAWRPASSPVLADAQFTNVQVSGDGMRMRAISLMNINREVAAFVGSTDGGATWSKLERPRLLTPAIAFDDSAG